MTGASEPSLPAATPPGKTNPWLIATLVTLFVGCVCVGACGLLFAFGWDILHELGLLSRLPAIFPPA